MSRPDKSGLFRYKEAGMNIFLFFVAISFSRWTLNIPVRDQITEFLPVKVLAQHEHPNLEFII